jgi:hypothetical protein
MVRELAWRTKPPEMNILEHAANVALFEGIAMFPGTPPSKIEKTKDAWKLIMYRTWHPSGGTTEVTITVKDSGKATVEQKNVK